MHTQCRDGNYCDVSRSRTLRVKGDRFIQFTAPPRPSPPPPKTGVTSVSRLWCEWQSQVGSVYVGISHYQSVVSATINRQSRGREFSHDMTTRRREWWLYDSRVCWALYRSRILPRQTTTLTARWREKPTRNFWPIHALYRLRELRFWHTEHIQK